MAYVISPVSQLRHLANGETARCTIFLKGLVDYAMESGKP